MVEVHYLNGVHQQKAKGAMPSPIGRTVTQILYVISIFRTLDGDKVGKNKKQFYKSHGSWAKLNCTQQNNAMSFCYNLSEENQKDILESTRKAMQQKSLDGDKGRQEPVTKDDLARIIELFRWPAAQVNITHSLCVVGLHTICKGSSTISIDIAYFIPNF